MARSVKGSVFFYSRNNGVHALTSEAVLENLGKRNDIQQRLNISVYELEELIPHIPVVPIFTFTENPRFERSPWFTGSLDLLDELRSHITDNGGKINDATYYVPFSNNFECGAHGKKEQIRELRYVTDEGQFVDTFEVSTSKLIWLWRSHSMKP